MRKARPADPRVSVARGGPSLAPNRRRRAPAPRFVGRLQLMDACREPGCPVCRCLDDLARRHLAAIVAEHVTDPTTRRRLTLSWGVCAAHAARLTEVPDAALGVGLVYQGLLDLARAWLADAERQLRPDRAEPGWRGRLGLRRRAGRMEPRRRPARCPVCVALIAAERDHLDTLLGGLEEPELAATYRQSAGLCLPHVELALARAGGGPGAALLVAETREALDRLAGDLRGFIDKHDHRARAVFTEREAVAWATAVGLVAGRAERFGSDMPPSGSEARS